MTFISECFSIFLIIFHMNLFCEIFFLICLFKNSSIQMIWQCAYSSCSLLFVCSIVCSSCSISLLMKSDLLLRMSVQLLSFFLQYWMIKSYSVKIFAHHACHSFNFLVVMKYCKFLWFNLMIVWCFAFYRYVLHHFNVSTIANISLSCTLYCCFIDVSFHA